MELTGWLNTVVTIGGYVVSAILGITLIYGKQWKLRRSIIDKERDDIARLQSEKIKLFEAEVDRLTKIQQKHEESLSTLSAKNDLMERLLTGTDDITKEHRLRIEKSIQQMDIIFKYSGSTIELIKNVETEIKSLNFTLRGHMQVVESATKLFLVNYLKISEEDILKVFAKTNEGKK